ncbi:hypothetical protein MLPF_0030 [Mycobacterium lepromatosis]|nr:hypothetical protein MLPF_0030 [Mycobacterium lepromatosis]
MSEFFEDFSVRATPGCDVKDVGNGFLHSLRLFGPYGYRFSAVLKVFAASLPTSV